MAWEDIASGLLGIGAASYLSNTDTSRIKAAADRYSTGFGELADSARSAGTFTPFTITGTNGATGTTTANSSGGFGGLSMNLDPTTAGQVAQQRSNYQNYINNYTGVGAPQVGSGGFTAAGAPSISQYNPAGGYWQGGPTAPGYTPDPWSAGALGREQGPGGTGRPTGLPGMLNIPQQQAALFQAQQQNPLYSQGQAAAGLQGALGSAGGQIIDQLGVGTGRSEADIYAMLEGMQQPDRERERLALRDELAAQGRLGTQTAQYGGTPEELARAKAVEEARSGNAFRAFQLAGEEQGRLAQQRLSAFGIGEQAAGRQDQGLLASFGVGLDAQGQATNLTNVLGGLSLQGRDIGNRFLGQNLQASLGARGQDVQSALGAQELQNQFGLGMFGQNVAQRGQDINAMLQGADTANRFNLGLYGTQMEGAIAQGQLAQAADALGLQANSDYGRIMADLYGTTAQQQIAQGQQAVQADANRANIFGSQVQQNAAELQAADAAYRASFLPEQSMLDQLGLGADMYEIAQRGTIQGEQIAQNAVTNAIENQYNMEGLLANIEQNRNQQIVDILLGTQNRTGDFSGGLFNDMTGWAQSQDWWPF